MSLLLVPLVGTYFRPPAKQVVAHLPRGASLLLWPEPTNPYDPKAIQVLVSLRDTLPILQYEALDEAMEGTGFSLPDLLENPEMFQLGYLARSGAKTALGGQGNSEVLAQADAWGQDIPDLDARLAFGLADQPLVQISFPGA